MNVLIVVSIISLIVAGSAAYYVASTTDVLSILNLKTTAESETDKNTGVIDFISCQSKTACISNMCPSKTVCVSDIESCYNLCGADSSLYENQEKACNEKGQYLCCQCYTFSDTRKAAPLTITASELQRAVDTSSEFRKLGKDAKFLISFFDGNGNPRSDLFFMVKENGKVTEGKEAYDVELQTGDYYIPEVKTTNDICSFIKRIKSLQEARVYLKINVIEAYSRYSGLSSCVPFS